MRQRLFSGPWKARLFIFLLLCVTLAALWNVAAGSATTPGAGQPDESATPATPTSAGEGHSGGKTTPPEVLIALLYILVLAGFVGFEVIGRVSPLLHTPLMSATNAISAISVVGALVIAGATAYQRETFVRILGFAAVTAATINVVGGFMITDRMLRMFKPKEGSR